MTDVDDWAAAIEQQEKEQLTGKVQQLSVKDAGPVVPEDPDPPGETEPF